MNSTDSMNTGLQCSVVSTWEERIWLDRREIASRVTAPKHGILARLRAWLHRTRARAQLGPAAEDSDLFGGDPEKRF